MAAAARKREQQISCCKVLLNGRVAPHVQANITKEMLKYLMFQRNQIPMAYEQMKFEYQRRSTSNTPVHAENSRPRGPHDLSGTAYKRLGQLIASVEEHLSNIDTLFTLSFVPRVLILFGATAVSPKEVHEIVFVNQESVHDSSLTDLRTKHSVRTLMRTLIADSSIWEAKPLPLTNTLLLVSAHRDSGLTWFKPKMGLKVPSRGQLYRCEIHCGHVECSNDCHVNCVPDKGNDGEDTKERFPKLPAESDDYIWYQAPVPIKGLQMPASKTSTTSDDVWG